MNYCSTPSLHILILNLLAAFAIYLLLNLLDISFHLEVKPMFSLVIHIIRKNSKFLISPTIKFSSLGTCIFMNSFFLLSNRLHLCFFQKQFQILYQIFLILHQHTIPPNNTDVHNNYSLTQSAESFPNNPDESL